MAPSPDGPSPTQRLALRSALLCVVPLLALALGSSGGQVLSCVVATSLFVLLEASLIFRVKLCRCCKRIPFALRLVIAAGLDIQGLWLFSSEDIDVVIKTGAGDTGGPVVNSLSVVLPCANEGDFVLKTVQSIFHATPREMLREILIVDDASTPPIGSVISSEDLIANAARIIRHETSEGLIRTKKHGGDEAQGDAIVFLDCHVKPMEHWAEVLLASLRENPKRVVVPFITSLNPDTWQEISPFAGGKKMCMTWNADFYWCNDYPGPYVPIMSGGLLAMTKYWWDMIGGYDSDMHAWGGENLDQSLRTWLCGGEIVVDEKARVAHMWRDPKNPKTMLHYAIPTNHVRRNRLRAADAWMGPWAKKVRTFPEFEDFRDGGVLSVGSLANIEPYKQKLQCKGFEWYLDHFKDYYLTTGRLPDAVFHIREASTRLCLTLGLEAGKTKSLFLHSCSQGLELQRFHEANAKATGGCCSGLKVWDVDACVASGGIGSDASPQVCESFGASRMQHIKFVNGGMIQWQIHGGGCLAPSRDSLGPELKNDGLALLSLCGAMNTTAKESQGFEKYQERADGSYQLREFNGGFCLGSVDREQSVLIREPCDNGNANQWWRHKDGMLHHVASGRCVDANDGATPILYPCYPVGQNPKQHFEFLANGLLQMPRSWADNGRLRYPAQCLDTRPVRPSLVEVVDCKEAEQRRVSWEKVWAETPLETRLYRDAMARHPNFLGR